MEDYSASPAEVEKTPLKKRRFMVGNFLYSWLEHRQEDDDDESEDKPSKPADKKKEAGSQPDSEQEWRPERLRERLANIFRGLVNLELMPSAPPTVAEVPVVSEDNSIENEVNNIEPEAPEADGLLAVSADAQRRYYGYEPQNEAGQEPDVEQEPQEPEVEIDDAETEQPNAAVRSEAEVAAGSGPAEAVGEVLRRRQAEQLERKVNRLRKRTRSIRQEQKEVQERQKHFGRQLEQQQRSQQKLEKVTIPKMEKARQRLQERLDKPLPVKPELPQSKVILEANPNKPLKVKMELQDRQTLQAKAEINQVELKAATSSVKEVQPEIRQTIDLAAAQKVSPEILDERRHEVKDEPRDDHRMKAPTSNLSRLEASDHRSEVPVSPPSYPPPILPPTVSQPESQPPKPDLPSYPPGSDLYKQAMRTGFWSGLALTVILLLVLMFMR